ncbi:MAG: FG-GAP-like repeat-containing protein [Janthinobacterium lividum]
MKLLYSLLLLAPAGTALAQTPATFAISTYTAGANSLPRGIAVADVNGDGRLDLVTANYGGDAAGVLLGQAGGGFAAVTTYSASASSQPSGIAVADMNGDGRLDLVTANFGIFSAGVLLGQAGGGFAPVTKYYTVTYLTYHGGSPSEITVADVNGDGRPDIVTANTGSNTAGVLLAQASGGFATVTTYSTGGSIPHGIAVADVNSDGRPDLVTANQYSNTAGVLLGQAGGGFAAVTTYSTGVYSQPLDIAVADVNGDGRPDLVTANQYSDAAGVLLGQASGGFAAVTAYSTGANSQPSSIAVADVNGDGRPDLVTANYGTHTVGVLLGQASGGFAAVTAYSTGANSQPSSIAVADVNLDGKPDLVTANNNTNDVSVLLNTTPAYLPTRAALPGASATLFPNPANTSATLTATGLPAAARTVEATLLSPIGQVVRRLSMPAALGAATGSIPTAGLAPGLYLLRLAAVDAQGAALGELPVQRLSVE